ncbi:MAG: 2'-deoxycytidine 5'-triphosphate deaminase [Planctomycetota bacterium]
MPNGQSRSGILVRQQIRALIDEGALTTTDGSGIPDSQIQPASLDLRLGPVGYRVQAGFLPESATVEERIKEWQLYEVDLREGAVLEQGQVYVLPLLERIDRPLPYQVRANPKSSTGRLDLFTRLMADRSPRFETASPGYQGPLWLEVVPRSFPVRVRQGLALTQVRFVDGDSMLSDDELRAEYEREPLLYRDPTTPIPLDEVRIDDGLCMGVALSQDPDVSGPIGYEALRFTSVVDMAKEGAHDGADFFRPIEARPSGRMLVEPEEFYLFASKERVRIPRHLAAEMAAYDVGIGELRTNYAGFFDNGFGGQTGSRAVLEVRPHDVPFLVEDGQVFFKLQFFKTLEEPDIAYGDGPLGSHYQGQGLRLSKHFRPVETDQSVR